MFNFCDCFACVVADREKVLLVGSWLYYNIIIMVMLCDGCGGCAPHDSTVINFKTKLTVCLPLDIFSQPFTRTFNFTNSFVLNYSFFKVYQYFSFFWIILHDVFL